MAVKPNEAEPLIADVPPVPVRTPAVVNDTVEAPERAACPASAALSANADATEPDSEPAPVRTPAVENATEATPDIEPEG